jgi:hypothetical protein
MNKKETDTEIENVQARLSIVREFSAELAQEVKALEEKLNFARGTRDIRPPEPALPAEQLGLPMAMTALPDALSAPDSPDSPDLEMMAPSLSIEEKIEEHLRGAIATTSELVRVTGRPGDEVIAAIRTMKPHVYNVGTTEIPRWSWRPGSHCPPADLRALIFRLISLRPMELREIIAATGVRESIVAGQLTELRRTESVVDFGSKFRGRWFIIPKNARDARLGPPRRK